MTAPSSPPVSPPPQWPTEPVKPEELAGARSQIAIFVVCSVAIGIACGVGGELGWGVAAMLALAAGIAVGLLAELGPRFGSIPGAVASILTMMVLTVLLAFVGGSTIAFACVPLAGAFILGLDWHLVRRLRPLPFAFGFAVVIAVASGESWTYAAGLVWLVLALAALASLEADRRAGQPQVVAVTGGPSGDDLRTGDLATTVLIAVAIALLAALVLSVPSCNRNQEGGSGGSDRSGEFGSGSGAGENGSGGASEHRYVPDPDGNYLIPEDGQGTGSGGEGIPSPELLPETGEPSSSFQSPDGSTLRAERLPDGTGRIEVTEPDGTVRSYTYEERPDGLIEIQEFDEDGNPVQTLYYDPQGELATGEPAADQSPSNRTPDRPEERKEDDDKEPSKLDWRLIVGVVLVLAAVAALIWWASKRAGPTAPPPDAPPWAIRLAREIDREGAARGPARRRSQSLTRYGDALRAGPIPDDRLADVVDVVSTALFGRSELGPDAQRWAESTWSQILESHPAPGRGDRRRAKSDATTSG